MPRESGREIVKLAPKEAKHINCDDSPKDGDTGYMRITHDMKAKGFEDDP